MPSFYSIAFIVNPMMRHETQGWSGMTLRGICYMSFMLQDYIYISFVVL